ncbi:MAG: alpha/beta fold hydrolase, partial [Balneolaceae bacterium]|nr:alpha/beta fold hydrolase [Balneolaceae bacterium]
MPPSSTSPIRETTLRLTAADGFPLAATVFVPSPETARSAGVVFGSALGVPRYYYYKLGRYLAESGFTVLTFDYRGIHESKGGGVGGSDMRMEEWGRLDIEAALNWVLHNGELDTLFYIGHSCGGQLTGLAPSSTSVDGMVFVAAQSGYWKHWDRPYRWGLWAVWQ